MERIDVAGVVVTDRDEPVGGRSVVLVDAGGARRDLVTDASGEFVARQVLPPYDVVVQPASGPMTVHLGLERTGPWIELPEPEVKATSSFGTQTIRVGVRGPACSTPSGTVTVMSRSPSGSGAATTTCAAADEVTVIDVDHRWRGLAVPAGERIDVHVVVADSERAAFSYARVEGPSAAPGDTVDVGVITPTPVPASDPISIGVADGAGLIDWRWSTSVFFGLAGDPSSAEAGFGFTAAPEKGAVVRAPLIPGVRMYATIAAIHPRSDDQGGFHRSAEVWSGARALSVDPFVLEIAPGPEIVCPSSGGALSRRGLGFEWRSGGIAALSTLTVVDTTHAAVRFRVLTAGQEVSFARLAQLGVPKLEIGNHVLDLSTSPGVGPDDAVSPDVMVRRRRHDRTRPGTKTYLRVPFQVTN